MCKKKRYWLKELIWLIQKFAIDAMHTHFHGWMINSPSTQSTLNIFLTAAIRTFRLRGALQKVGALKWKFAQNILKLIQKGHPVCLIHQYAHIIINSQSINKDYRNVVMQRDATRPH